MNTKKDKQKEEYEQLVDSRTEIRKNIGKAISERIQETGTSYVYLNRTAYLTHNQVKGIENGTDNYTIMNLIKLLDALSLTIKIEKKEE